MMTSMATKVTRVVVCDEMSDEDLAWLNERANLAETPTIRFVRPAPTIDLSAQPPYAEIGRMTRDELISYLVGSRDLIRRVHMDEDGEPRDLADEQYAAINELLKRLEYATDRVGVMDHVEQILAKRGRIL